MKKFSPYFSFFLALAVSISLLLACGDKKDSDNSKEETKKEETKKEQTKTESTTSGNSGGNQVYFVEQYTSDGQEVGKSEKFFIKSKGGYITAMLKTANPVGVGSVDVRVERESLDGSDIISTTPYDVSPDKNYFYFDKITFYKSGDYKITVFKKDGTPIASGNVRIEFE